MYSGPLVFTQIMNFMPLKTFQRCVAKYQGNFSVKHFTCMDHFRIMAFAQLTYRESLRDIEACLRAQSKKLYHMGNPGTSYELFRNQQGKSRDAILVISETSKHDVPIFLERLFYEKNSQHKLLGVHY